MIYPGFQKFQKKNGPELLFAIAQTTCHMFCNLLLDCYHVGKYVFLLKKVVFAVCAAANQNLFQFICASLSTSVPRGGNKVEDWPVLPGLSGQTFSQHFFV